MNFVTALAIFVGAGIGALLRWGLAHAFNAQFPALPPGTLVANVVGALMMGFLMGAFLQYESLSPVWRLALTTGFLGGLTTFSAFSGESAVLLLRGDFRWAALHVLAHVVGSVVATLAGWMIARSLFGFEHPAP